ncbi:MAG TPA: hypothetical protein VFU81_05110 [Thermomicrobiales bacterium]|nr:hypothetical protein [Thermomicrobiales bacterium]
MNVGQAKAAARAWAQADASALAGFQGALIHGSSVWLPDDAAFPAASDIDVLIVLDGALPPVKRGKFRYRDVILDVAELAADEIATPEQILGQSHLAGSFQAPSVIADPTGRLTMLQAAVARDYAKLGWVERRREDARDKALRYLPSIDAADSWPEQVTSWLFAAGVTTHILLVAGLRNPTVRRRYLATRNLLGEYGRRDAYEPLLELLGCAHMTRPRVEGHLAALADAFDAAKEVVATPFVFAGDISDRARPIAIDGSRAMIEAGDHREAVFWIAATYCRCQQIFERDAPAELRRAFDPGYRRLLADLGVASPADLRQRGERVATALPWIWQVADEIIAANPTIVR